MKYFSYFFIFFPVCLLLLLCSTNVTYSMISSALNQLRVSEESHSVFDLVGLKDSNLSAITQIKTSQRYGEVTYNKFNPFSLMRFYGFTSFNMLTRSRQDLVAYSIGSYLFPSVIILDLQGKDINAHAKTTISSNVTRFGLFFNPYNTGSGEDFFAILEFDFTGTTIANTYTAKIRHTFGEYVWKSGSFLFGQYYHPLFLPESFPRTVNNSLGAIFDPQSLVPQLRLTQMIKNVELIAAIASEAYIRSWGPSFETSIYIRNAIIPNIHFQLKRRMGPHFIGAAIDYKRLVPRLVSDTNYKVNEYIDSLIGEVFVHNVFSWGELNAKVVYAENGSDQLLISGFGIRTSDPVTNFQTYSNTAALSAWIDTFCVFYGDTMSVGLFAGGVKNLGSKNALYIAPGDTEPTVFAIDRLAQTVSFDLRLSPRFLYAWGAFRFGAEFIWDWIAFGKLNRYAQIINAKAVHSFSYEIAFNYLF